MENVKSRIGTLVMRESGIPVGQKRNLDQTYSRISGMSRSEKVQRPIERQKKCEAIGCVISNEL